MSTKFSITADIRFDIKEGSADEAFLKERASFVHTEGCEYILHAGSDYFRKLLEDMKRAGCSAEMQMAYKAAALSGAERVNFYC